MSFFLAVIGFLFFCPIVRGDTPGFMQAPVFVIGQDVRSIEDFYSSLQAHSAKKDLHYPDGIMAYTAINDPSGLSDAVDHGAGVNCVDDLLRKYPDIRVVQIGLYMKYMLKEVVSGDLDGNIDKIGEWIKHSGRHVYLRVGYEFDNPDNEYDPQQYVQAYRYIVDHLRKMKLNNVDFVWHSIAWKDSNWPAYDPLKWYPGDQYVDWLGISFFDASRHEERDAAADLARKINKPLMIAESSPFKQYTDEDKLSWIKSLFEYVNRNKVRFLSYINVNWDGLPLFENEKWGDARLEKGGPVLMDEWLSKIGKYRQ